MHFLLDKKLTAKNEKATLKISSLIQNTNGEWVQSGPNKVFTMSDITQYRQDLLFNLLETLLKDEFKLRRQEGRFFSENDDISVIRLPLSTAVDTLKKLYQAQRLIIKDIKNHKSNITSLNGNFKINWVKQGDGTWLGNPSLESSSIKIQLSEIEFFLETDPILLFKNFEIIILNSTISLDWFKRIWQKKPLLLSDDQLQTVLKDAASTRPRSPEMILPNPLKLVKGGAYPEIIIFPDKNLIQIRFQYNNYYVESSDVRSEIIDYQQGIHLIRDLKEEKEYLNTLKQMDCKLQSEEQSLFYIPSFRFEQTIQLLTDKAWLIKDNKNREVKLMSNYEMNINQDQADWSVTGSLTFEKSKLDIQKAIKSYQNHSWIVELDRNTVGLIPMEWMRQNDVLWRSVEVEHEKITLKKNYFHNLINISKDQQRIKLDQTVQKLLSWFGNAGTDGNTNHDVSICGTLREYQIHGLDWLHTLHQFKMGGILADDMGLGKTIQALAFLNSNAIRNEAYPNLIIMPRSLIFNWTNEIQKFTPELKIIDFSLPDRDLAKSPLDGHVVVLTTYAIARMDTESLKKIYFNCIILDEAQAIKNYQSKTREAIQELQCNTFFSLTGTPLENNEKELWSQLDIVMPGLVGSLDNFCTKLTDSPEQIQRVIKPFILRRTKEEVLKELPEKQEQIIYSQLYPEQEKLYQSELQVMRKQLLDDSPDEKPKPHDVLRALLRLRQICCHPSIIQSDLPSAKFDDAAAMIDEILEEKHKILIFSQFTSLLALFRKHIEEKGIIYSYLDGKTRDRVSEVQKFQSDSDCKIFLISLKAGGFGLNLTEADYVMIYDPWWNPASERQAIDRAHRIGQSKKVTVYKHIAKNTVEEKIQQLQQVKNELFLNLIQKSQAGLPGLKYEDINYLFS